MEEASVQEPLGRSERAVTGSVGANGVLVSSSQWALFNHWMREGEEALSCCICPFTLV